MSCERAAPSPGVCQGRGWGASECVCVLASLAVADRATRSTARAWVFGSSVGVWQGVAAQT